MRPRRRCWVQLHARRAGPARGDRQPRCSSVRRLSLPYLPLALPARELTRALVHSRPQDRRWRQAPHQLPQGARLVPPLVHDGPDRRHGARQGADVLRLDAVGPGLGGGKVRLRLLLSRDRSGRARAELTLAHTLAVNRRTRSSAPLSCPTLRPARRTSSATSAQASPLRRLHRHHSTRPCPPRSSPRLRPRRKRSSSYTCATSASRSPRSSSTRRRSVRPLSSPSLFPLDLEPDAGATSPADLNQAGLAETVALAIGALPQEVQGMFWSNIVCIGGSVQFPGFAERLCVLSSLGLVAFSSGAGRELTMSGAVHDSQTERLALVRADRV